MESHKEMLKSLYPVGKERWIKVLYKDFDWCVENLFIANANVQDRLKEGIKNPLGFEVTSIGVRDDFIPQVSVVLELKDEIIGRLHGQVDSDFLSLINEVFNVKLEELKDKTTITKMPEEE